jgi:hypothetical protein
MRFGVSAPSAYSQSLEETLVPPAVVIQFRVFQISGRILQDGVFALGVGLQLTRTAICGNPADVVVASTTTAADGSYRFANMAALSGQEVFCARYLSPSLTDDPCVGRAYSSAIFLFDSAGQAVAGDIEISNNRYLFPNNNDARNLPLDFVWVPRVTFKLGRAQKGRRIGLPTVSSLIGTRSCRRPTNSRCASPPRSATSTEPL